MPRRKSLTRRFLDHLLLLSLARTTLTVLRRGRAWDEWDERGPDPEPATTRRPRRFAQTLSFSAIFFAGLALSAGAGNGVQSLLEDDATAPASALGASGASGPTGPTPLEAASASAPAAAPAAARELVERVQAVPARPVATGPAVARTAVLSTRAARPTVAGATSQKRTAVAKKHAVVRPGVTRSRPQAPKKQAAKPDQAPKAPPLDPEVDAAAGATVWLNRAAPDPTPPAARLKLQFARQLVTYSRLAHVDWALVLATLRVEGRNGRTPAGPNALRTLALRLASLGARKNPWAASLAYSSDTSHADRVGALRHYYRAVGLPSLVHGLLSQKADLQDRVLHDSRLSIYAGGRNDVARGRVDVRVLAFMLYMAETYHEVTVSCLVTGHGLYSRPGVVSAHVYGRAVDLAALNNVSITGHQQPGGLTENAVRSMLMLPGGMLPAQVISLLGLGGPSFPLANHYDHIHVGY